MLITWGNVDPEKSPHLVMFLSLFTSEKQTPLPVISEVTLHDDWTEIFVHVSLYRISRETRNSHTMIPALFSFLAHRPDPFFTCETDPVPPPGNLSYLYLY